MEHINVQDMGKEVDKLYNIRLKQLKYRLAAQKGSNGSFSLCIDAWTSKSQHAFLGVTIHWIDSDWQPQNFILQLLDLKKRHTGAYINTVLNRVLHKFEIRDSISAITMDNASNNKKFASFYKDDDDTKSSDQFQAPIYCLAHLLNLIVQAVLAPLGNKMTRRQLRQIATLEETDESDQSTEEDEVQTQPITSTEQPITSQGRKRQRTTTIIGSTVTALDLFDQSSGTLAILKVRKIVVLLRLRQILILELQRQLRTIDDSLPIRKPTLDTPTRWNSTYWMLKNFIRLIEPITAVESKHPIYFEGLALTEYELCLIEKLLPILEDFTNISTVLQVEKTPTLS